MGGTDIDYGNGPTVSGKAAGSKPEDGGAAEASPLERLSGLARFGFRDSVVESVQATDLDQLCTAVTEYLCGEKYYGKLGTVERHLLTSLVGKAQGTGLTYEQFNELLLLLDQDRVSRDFFRFLFGQDKISLDELKIGITRFRGYAMICFGSFRFAYKSLSRASIEHILKILSTYLFGPEDIRARPPMTLDIDPVDRERTWYTGYISGKTLGREATYANQVLNSRTDEAMRNQLYEVLEPSSPVAAQERLQNHVSLAETYESRLAEIETEVRAAQTKALSNTHVYLVWDFMDVYVATSMRQRWEFEETYDLIAEVFKRQEVDNGTQNSLAQLNLRFFDPTQSLSPNRIDKGLVEGLMLKRALCTIYMAQESETLGKDSELAATLAQGKPVIAYVPSISVENHSSKVAGYPLEYFARRLLIFNADRLFEEPRVIEALDEKMRGSQIRWRNVLLAFDEQYVAHRKDQPFTLIADEEQKFKDSFEHFPALCTIFAILESFSFDQRARTLREIHPLALQVDLSTGVANGVLVARSPREVRELILGLLSNSLTFEIKTVRAFDITSEQFDGFMGAIGDVASKFKLDGATHSILQVSCLTDQEASELSSASARLLGKYALAEGFSNFSEAGATLLEEVSSLSPYRVVTNDDKLTNSFWNFYGTREEV